MRGCWLVLCTDAPDVVDALVHVPETVALVWPIDELLQVRPHAVVVDGVMGKMGVGAVYQMMLVGGMRETGKGDQPIR